MDEQVAAGIHPEEAVVEVGELAGIIGDAEVAAINALFEVTHHPQAIAEGDGSLEGVGSIGSTASIGFTGSVGSTGSVDASGSVVPSASVEARDRSVQPARLFPQDQ